MFIFSFIGGINIITHAMFMNIRIVHTLRPDCLYISMLVCLKVCLKV